MGKLQDLPAELTVLIAQEVGGGELRKDVRYLTLYRKWYESAHPVFHSGIHLSNITIYGCNVSRLGDVAAYSGERKLMHKNTQNIDIRVFGHWHDKTSDSDYGLFPTDDVGILKGVQESAEFDNDPFVFGERPEKAALIEWQTQVLNPRLDEFFGDLSRFSFLQNLTLQAMQGLETNGRPIEKYLNAPTMRSLLSSLPQLTGLKGLALDICSEIDCSTGHFHMCEELSRVLPRVEAVRLRFTSICPSIFKLDSDLSASDVKLKNLIVKLHHPRYPKSPVQPPFRTINCDSGSGDNIESHRNQTCFGNCSCVLDPEDMIRGAQGFLEALAQIRSTDLALETTCKDPDTSGQATGSRTMDHGLELCRISFVGERHIVRVVDCLTMQDGWMLSGWPLAEFFGHQDYGSPCWWEGDESRLAMGGPFKFRDEQN